MAVLSAEMTTSPSPPAHPHESDVWHNTLNGRSYSWTIGPSGRGAWVATPTVAPKMPQPIPSDAPDITNPVPKITMAGVPPLTPVAGDLWFDTVRGYLFVFYDDGNTTQWVVANPGRGGQEGPPGLPGSPSGPAGGDLFGFYPDPVINPSTTDNWLMTTVSGVSQWAAPPSTAPSGSAGGDLAGTYPNPSVKVDLALGGNPTAITQATTDSSQRLATTAFVKTNIAAIPPPPTVTVPAGTIAFGGAGGVVTGNSTLAWNDTGKSFAITGYTGAAAAFSAAGSVPASPAVDAFLMSISNPSGNTGNIFRLRAGASGTTDQFKVDMTGDGAFSGSVQAFALSAPPAGGNGAFGLFLGNFSGGNIGLYFGTSTPTLSTFGKFGSIYLNATTPGLPWYNNNGTTGWDRLVGETSTQTLTNKTITGYLPSGSAAGGDLAGTYPNPTIKPSVTNGQVLTTVAGVAAWAAASGGGAVTFVGTTPPPTPTDGQLWFYTDGSQGGGNLYIRYNDGNSTAWVPAAPAAGSSSVPPGAIMDFAGAAAPGGWLLCQGQSVTTAAYPALFAAIGYLYGGSGVNFNVPDLGGRVVAGKEATATRLTTAGAGIDGSVVGAAGGAQTHALVLAELPSHAHNITFPGTSATPITANGGMGNYADCVSGAGVHFYYSQPGATDAQGSGVAHTVTQPTLIMNKIIKT